MLVRITQSVLNRSQITDHRSQITSANFPANSYEVPLTTSRGWTVRKAYTWDMPARQWELAGARSREDRRRGASDQSHVVMVVANPGAIITLANGS